MIAFLLGIKGSDDYQKVASNIALAFGVMIAVLNASEEFFDHRTLWIRYTVTTNQLSWLFNELDYLVTCEFEDIQDLHVRLDDIHSKFQHIIYQLHEAWKGFRQFGQDNRRRSNRMKEGGLSSRKWCGTTSEDRRSSSSPEKS